MKKFLQIAPIRASTMIMTVLSILLARSALGEEVDHRNADSRDVIIESTAGDIDRGYEILLEELLRYLERARSSVTALSILERPHRAAGGPLHQLMEQATVLSALRRQAIAALERFVTDHPDDPDLTPDALLRLAELHYEQDSTEHLEAAERYAELLEQRVAGRNVELPPEPVMDLSRAIELTRHIVARFPSSPNIDGALYLLGLSLYETQSDVEARSAWLQLVCSNRFQYQGPQVSSTHPSAPSSRPFVNPYAQCTPIVSGSRFVTETWFRIGESHFDYDSSPNGIDLAIASYQHAASDRSSPILDISLYKLAWSFYRSDRYAEAIESFTAVVALADEMQQRGSPLGSLVRPEAIQYLAICFTEDDWNGDTRPDAPRGIERLQDPRLLPQNRGFTAEVYLATGDVYFDLARYADAVEVYELTLRRWPLLLQAPRVLERIALAHERNRDFDETTAARDRLIAYGPGSEWYRAHIDSHPDVVREASQLARNMLYEEALRHHWIAQRLRDEGESSRNAATLDRARAEYALAADRYTTYLERYPHDPDAYEITFNRAEASYFSDRFRDAADAYTGVRDSTIDTRFRELAAFRAVRSLEQLCDVEERAGRLRRRRVAPAPTGAPLRVESIELPEPLRALVDAYDAYAHVPQGQRSRAASFGLESALTLYRYGHWDEARRRLASIYEDHCNDSEAGRDAWQHLVTIATALGEREEVERLRALQEERQCAPPATPQNNVGGTNAP